MNVSKGRLKGGDDGGTGERRQEPALGLLACKNVCVVGEVSKRTLSERL